MKGVVDFASEKSFPTRPPPDFAGLKRRATGAGAISRSKKPSQVEVAQDFTIEKSPHSRPPPDFARPRRAEGRFPRTFPGPFPQLMNRRSSGGDFFTPLSLKNRLPSKNRQRSFPRAASATNRLGESSWPMSCPFAERTRSAAVASP